MIIVLEPDPALVDDVRREVEGLGWTCEQSLGRENAILSLSGSGDVAELEAVLARRPGLDLIRLLAGRDYVRTRARRRFLTGVSSGLGMLTAIGLGVPVVGFLLPPAKEMTRRDVVRAAGVDEIPENAAKTLRLLGIPMILVHQGEGRYFALSAVCTHMNVCQLEWDGDRQQLICPCHGGAFDLHGNVVQGPPSIPLPSFDVERIGSELFVRRKA